MSKLTKTQQKLVERAKRRGYSTVETGAGRGPKGGRLVWGDREVQALHLLVKSGIARITSREGGVESMGNGYSCTVASILYELTAKA